MKTREQMEIYQNQRDAFRALLDTVQDNDVLNTLMQDFKTRRAVLNARVAQSFRVGDQVEFDGRYGRKEQGQITKINTKSILVKTLTTNWKVSPSLLRSVA
jgi:hypothetical protein